MPTPRSTKSTTIIIIIIIIIDTFCTALFSGVRKLTAPTTFCDIFYVKGEKTYKHNLVFLATLTHSNKGSLRQQ